MQHRQSNDRIILTGHNNTHLLQSLCYSKPQLPAPDSGMAAGTASQATLTACCVALSPAGNCEGCCQILKAFNMLSVPRSLRSCAMLFLYRMLDNAVPALPQNSKPRPLPTLRPIISKMPLPAMNSTKRIPKKPSCKRTAFFIDLSVQWHST